MSKQPYIYTLPETFIRDQSVPARWRVWAILNGFFINNQKCWASNEWIGERVGSHKDSVSQAVKELESMKMIICERTARTRLISPMIGADAYLRSVPTPISDRRDRLSISDSISDSNNDFSKSEKSSLSEKGNTTDRDVEKWAVDGDGAPVRPKSKKVQQPGNHREVFGLMNECAKILAKEFGVEPIVGVKEYKAIQNALKHLKAPELKQMVEDAIANGMAEKRGMSLNAILSTNELNKYRLENYG